MSKKRNHTHKYLDAHWLIGSLAALLLLAACGRAPTPTAAPTVSNAGPTAAAPAPVTVVPATATVLPPATTGPGITATPTPVSRALPAPTRSGDVLRDVTYCTPGGIPVKMDLYLPKPAPQPYPVLLYVHGGGWRAGDKKSGELLQAAPLFTANGYVVASIDYRLAPTYRWPAQIEDVKCAVRFLRANAAVYNLDPNRIGAAGSSAGGHLVAMLGLAGPSAGFDVGEYLNQSSRVRVVIDLFGPADLTATDFDIRQAQVAKQVFGAKVEDDPVLVQASPVTYITRDAPPFLILQGDKDTLVPPSQSVELQKRLQAAGGSATLVIVKNAGHGFVPSGGPISPTLPELDRIVLDFMDKNLK